MEDFFKQFKENMENRPEPPFEKRDWKDLEKRLNQHGKRPAAFAWWWLALPLLLLLLASNAFFFTEWQKANRQSTTVERIQDTVFHTKVIYITDTIYQTRIVHEKVMENTPDFLPSFLSNRTLGWSSLQQPNDDKNLAFPPSHFLLQNGKGLFLENWPDTTAIVQSADLEKLAEWALETLPYPATGIPHQPVDVKMPERKKTLRHYLYTMRPKGVNAGVSAGWAYPFKKGLAGISGYAAGLEASVDFSSNLRLWADAAYSNVRFSSTQMDDGVGIPAVNPPGPEFVFINAEVPQPSLQYSLGMQYSFNVLHTLQPFIGVGWGAVSMFPYEITYDFRDNDNGIEWIFEKEMNKQGLLTGLLFLRAGVEHEFVPQWRWVFRATYRSQLNNMGLQAPNMFGLQAGVLHRF